MTAEDVALVDEAIGRFVKSGLTPESALQAVQQASLSEPLPPAPGQPQTGVRLGSVALSYVHDAIDVAHSWHSSMLGLVLFDMANAGRLESGPIAMRCSTDGLAAARNAVVEHFLEKNTDEWLFWVDTDMGFQPDTVERLLEAADPIERPIVGALCFAYRTRSQDAYGGYTTAPACTIMDWVHKDGDYGFVGRTSYPINTLVRCAGTGSAAILIHRSVLERIYDELGPVWYDKATIANSTGTDGKQLLGEDLSFCVRAGALNIPIHVHTGVRTTHLKNLWLGEAHYWDFAVAPPATAETAVIVPVLRRPQNAEPFMRSLKASTGLAKVYAVADDDDEETIKAWVAAGADVLTGGVHTFAEKCNLGYERTNEPWMFFVGDDVQFHAGWLDHAQAIAGDQFHVIGTNDLGNPRVTSGEHAVHILIRRRYVDEVGASWDGSEIVAHEGYRHWFVDDEIVCAAKQRGIWAMALASKVEHLHPNYDRAPMDDVYELGQSSSADDRARFLVRLQASQEAQ